MERRKPERTEAYVELGIDLAAYMEDGVTSASISGKLHSPSYGSIAAAVREVAALDISIERKLLLFGAAVQQHSLTGLDHMIAGRIIAGGSRNRLMEMLADRD